MSKQTAEDEKKVRKLAENNKDQLVKQFCPAFVFAKDEYLFPTSHEKFVENVMIAKRDHYEALFKKAGITINLAESLDNIYDALNDEQKKKINKDELEQYLVIKKNFFDPDPEGKFTMAGFDKLEVQNYIQEENNKEHKNVEKLLNFDEKAKGYKLGSKVDMRGIKPDEHGKVKAPMDVMYEPVEDGVIISYNVLYPMSGPIPGSKMLYDLLPNWVTKKLHNFAVHPGDVEGVKIKVTIDPETGEAKMAQMVTFAHGPNGSRAVGPDKLSYDEKGRPYIYVSKSTHAAYIENFPGRNKFLDKVSHGASLEPTEFVDVTHKTVNPERSPKNYEICNHWGSPQLPSTKPPVLCNKDFATSDHAKRREANPYQPFSETRLGKFIAATRNRFLSVKIPTQPEPVVLEQKDTTSTKPPKKGKEHVKQLAEGIEKKLQEAKEAQKNGTEKNNPPKKPKQEISK